MHHFHNKNVLTFSLLFLGKVNIASAISNGTIIGTRFGAVLGSDGQVQRVGGTGTVLGAMLGGLLSVPLIVIGSAAIASTLVNRNSEIRVQTREITQSLLESTSTLRVGLIAALGAGISSASLRLAVIPLTFRGGITLSGFNGELGEALASGVVSGVAAGIGATLSTELMRRWVSPEASANLDGTTVTRSDERHI